MNPKNQTVTRQDLANAVYQKIGLSKAESKNLVDRIVSIIADELANEGIVKLAKFGTFSSRRKKERMGRNPKTGKPVPIEARRVLIFKASQHLIDRINDAK